MLLHGITEAFKLEMASELALVEGPVCQVLVLVRGDEKVGLVRRVGCYATFGIRRG